MVSKAAVLADLHRELWDGSNLTPRGCCSSCEEALQILPVSKTIKECKRSGQSLHTEGSLRRLPECSCNEVIHLRFWPADEGLAS
jgi:hypothetical protein